MSHIQCYFDDNDFETRSKLKPVNVPEFPNAEHKDILPPSVKRFSNTNVRLLPFWLFRQAVSTNYNISGVFQNTAPVRGQLNGRFLQGLGHRYQPGQFHLHRHRAAPLNQAELRVAQPRDQEHVQLARQRNRRLGVQVELHGKVK